ncbi:hypothetical protein PTKIN_Ptkin03bG0097600 [Pterospermum kingtungense]
MAFHFLLLFSLFNLAFAGNHHGAFPEEVHWKSIFPNTPMPKALKDLLPPPGNDQNPSVHWNKHKNNEVMALPPRFRAYNYGKSSTGFESPNSLVSGKPVKFDGDKAASKEFRGSMNNHGDSRNGMKSVNGGDPIHPFIIYDNEDPSKKFKRVNDGPINPFIIYGKEGANKEFNGNKNSLGGKHDNAAINETIYFFQEDLHPGKMVKLPLLTKTRDMATFLSYRVAESIPFSSDKLPEIFKYFSFQPESSEANVMKETIKTCERQVIAGEEMYCATSFESFVDWSVSKLGKNVQLLSNELGKETENPVFTMGRGIKNMGEEEVVCHKMPYPSAVFLCHSIERTVVYRVPLVGIDTKANALAICHKDTSAWNPEHPAFLTLKVKPGTVPICHFVVRDTLVWVRK